MSWAALDALRMDTAPSSGVGYDLRRLRLNGLIGRLPHTNRYVLTAEGIRIAVFRTKVYNRLLAPLTAANQPQAPPDLRAALAAITAMSTAVADDAPSPTSLRDHGSDGSGRDTLARALSWEEGYLPR